MPVRVGLLCVWYSYQEPWLGHSSKKIVLACVCGKNLQTARRMWPGIAIVRACPCNWLDFKSIQEFSPCRERSMAFAHVFFYWRNFHEFACVNIDLSIENRKLYTAFDFWGHANAGPKEDICRIPAKRVFYRCATVIVGSSLSSGAKHVNTAPKDDVCRINTTTKRVLTRSGLKHVRVVNAGPKDYVCRMNTTSD